MGRAVPQKWAEQSRIEKMGRIVWAEESPGRNGFGPRSPGPNQSIVIFCLRPSDTKCPDQSGRIILEASLIYESSF